MATVPPAQAPAYRPTWLLVLGAIMVLAGGRSLVNGVQKLRDPLTVLGGPVVMGSVATETELDLERKLAAASAAAVAPHGTGVRVAAIVEVLAALFTLYAAAAVLARDRHGRALALGVAFVGIVYQLATLPVYVALMRDYAAHGVPLLAQAMVLQAKPADGRAPAVDDLVRRLPSAMVGWIVLLTAVGIAGSLVLLRYFGGRRGRVLYGIEPARDKKPGR